MLHSVGKTVFLRCPLGETASWFFVQVRDADTGGVLVPPPPAPFPICRRRRANPVKISTRIDELLRRFPVVSQARLVTQDVECLDLEWDVV